MRRCFTRIIASFLAAGMALSMLHINAHAEGIEDETVKGDILLNVLADTNYVHFNTFDSDTPGVVRYEDDYGNEWCVEVEGKQITEEDRNGDGEPEHWIDGVESGEEVVFYLTNDSDYDSQMLLNGSLYDPVEEGKYAYSPQFEESHSMDVFSLDIYGSRGGEDEWCPVVDMSVDDIYITQRYSFAYDIMPARLIVRMDDDDEFKGSPRDVCRMLEEKYPEHTFDFITWTIEPVKKWEEGETYSPSCGLCIDGVETDVMAFFNATLMAPVLSVQVDDVSVLEGDYQDYDGYSLVVQEEPDPYSGVPGAYIRIWEREAWKGYDATPKSLTVTLDESAAAGEDRVITGSVDEVRTKLAQVLGIKEYEFPFEVVGEQIPENGVTPWTKGSHQSSFNVMGVIATYNVDVVGEYGKYNGLALISGDEAAADEYAMLKNGDINESLTGFAEGPIAETIDIDDFDNNTYIEGSEGFWYVKTGRVDSTFNGTACGTIDGVKQWWYVKSGKVNLGYSGFAHIGNSWMYYKNGKINKTFTGTVCGKINGVKQWWYVRNGKVMTGYTGLAIIGTSTMYFENGAVNKSFSGSYRFKGKVYKIKNGKVVK